MLEPLPEIAQGSLVFLSSAFMFRMGLATMTFERMRPLDNQIADYFFFASLFLLLCSKERILLRSRGSGVLAASAVILCGVLVSGLTTGPGVRIVILFGLFAPLAIAHSKDLRRNIRFLVAGVFTSCVIAILRVSAWPGIENALSINPHGREFAEEIGRFEGLAAHPNSLGISAALGVLLAVGLLSFEKKTRPHLSLYLQILVCTVGGILSGSRTFIVALVPGLFVLALRPRWDRKFVLRFCGGLAGVFLLLASIDYLFVNATTSYAERLSKTSAEDYENSVRLEMVVVAMAEIAQKPITGWGLEHFGEAGMIYVPDAGDFLPAHVNFLHFWYAEGILGAIGYALLFVLPVKRMVQVLKNGCPHTLANALRLGVGVYLLLFIASSLAPLLLNRLIYIPLFLFAGLAANIPGQLRARLSKKPAREQVADRALLRPAELLGETNSTGDH